MRSQEDYRKLCQSEESIPLFSRDWWLDIVCGEKNWDARLLYSSTGEIMAAMPLFIPIRGTVIMPFYTQTMGPWLRESAADQKAVSRLTQRQMLLCKLVAELKDIPTFLQNFHYTITDWLPFYWEGYRQTTRYTYLLDEIKNHERVWNEMATNVRRNILKAKEKHQITIRRGIPTDELIRIQAMSFERQRLMPKGTSVLRQLIEISRQRQQGDVWGAYDRDGNLHAAVFVVWQSSSAYYIAGGGDPSLRASGAHSRVMWQAIQDVSAYTDRFDFEGSMLPGVERFFREFGARQTPYFSIQKGKLSLCKRAFIKWKRIRNS